jgi:hypothetical protein
MPSNDGLGLDEDDNGSLTRPGTYWPSPEEPVRRVQARASALRSSQDIDLDLFKADQDWLVKRPDPDQKRSAPVHLAG